MACTTTFHFPCARSTSPSFNFNHYSPNNPSSGTLHSRSKALVKSRASEFPTGSVRLELDENPEGIISGEWPENFSLLSYDDLRVYLQSQAQSENDQSRRSALLSSVMSRPVWTAKAGQTLEEINHHFDFISGLPVVDDEQQCVGIISKKDKAKASNGLRTRIGEMMSTPAITLPMFFGSLKPCCSYRTAVRNCAVYLRCDDRLHVSWNTNPLLKVLFSQTKLCKWVNRSNEVQKQLLNK